MSAQTHPAANPGPDAEPDPAEVISLIGSEPGPTFWCGYRLPMPSIGPIDLHHAFDTGRVRADHGAETGGPIGYPPLELEIGSGKGTFLVAQARLHAGVRFLGIEYERKYARHAADRVHRHGLGNVRVLHAEAGAFVRSFVPAGLLARVHIYFPDPWPKKRHHKRRLIQAPFLRELGRVLVPGGEVSIATDHADYFTWMEQHAAAVADLFDRKPFEPPASAGEGEWVGTNFERKYRIEGRSFQGMRLVLRAPHSPGPGPCPG